MDKLKISLETNHNNFNNLKQLDNLNYNEDKTILKIINNGNFN